MPAFKSSTIDFRSVDFEFFEAYVPEMPRMSYLEWENFFLLIFTITTFDRRPEEQRVSTRYGAGSFHGNAAAFNALLYLYDSFRYSFSFFFFFKSHHSAFRAAEVQIDSPVFPFRSRSRAS